MLKDVFLEVLKIRCRCKGLWSVAMDICSGRLEIVIRFFSWRVFGVGRSCEEKYEVGKCFWKVCLFNLMEYIWRSVSGCYVVSALGSIKW